VRRLLAPIVILALAPAASAAVPNACTLLTPAQAETAVGGKIKQRRGFSSRGGAVCIWTSSANVMLNVQVLQMSKADFKKGLANEQGAQALRGVGELAYALGGGKTVTAWHRGVTLTVAYNTVPAGQTAKRVASAVVARL
jgi:hypothetical protein